MKLMNSISSVPIPKSYLEIVMVTWPKSCDFDIAKCKELKPVLSVVQVISDISKPDCTHEFHVKINPCKNKCTSEFNSGRYRGSKFQHLPFYLHSLTNTLSVKFVYL